MKRERLIEFLRFEYAGNVQYQAGALADFILLTPAEQDALVEQRTQFAIERLEAQKVAQEQVAAELQTKIDALK